MIALSPQERDEVISGTIAWINEVRTGNGLEPVKDISHGARRSSQCCPIAQSVKGVADVVRVATREVVFTDCQLDRNATISLSQHAATFVERFDACLDFHEYLAR